MSLNAHLEPALYLFAGLFGVAGVALAALAAHGGGEANLAASASAMCLAHAPALLALALGNARLRTAWLAGFLMIVGTLLFASDLVTLRFTGSGLFPYAAPTGGWAMMLGWLVVAAGAVFRVRA
ncbi:DUF423 domain-containing protein [Rhizobium leguminosarum]|uniref:DUF423 domain-containing protein n=1 Tax=Rhizobium leguminosarum TaxID=384 RepID=UPI00048505C9|nr:DUF423 domain-containing protein [Rhizobium leguminosarum]